jgi:hypothetical protein
MERKADFFLLLLLIFINFSCNTRENSIKEKPRSVALQPAAADTSLLETGIDAIPDGDLIRVEWSAGESTVLYEIYRGTIPAGVFTKLVTVEIPTQSYEDQVPSKGVRYYYFVRALNDEGIQSDPSDTLSYRLIQKAEILDPVGASGNTPTFNWRDPNSPQANDYIIRLKATDTGRMIWLSQFQNSNYGPDHKSIAFNADHRALLDSLASGVDYQWRIDIIGNEKNCGSESPWTSIQIQ